MEFIDLHIHLQDYKANCATDIVKKAQISGLKKMVCAGTSSHDWMQVARWAEQEPQLIIPAFGLHPWYAPAEQQGWEDRLTGFLSAFPSALVGETGIDGLKPDTDAQKKCFEFHARLASDLRRPLVVHVVKAFSFFEGLWQTLPEKFMFHSFNAREEQLREILRHGGYVSFNASILKNRDSLKLATVVPSDRLLFESDGPYQPQNKGELSVPFFIPELITFFAKARGEDVEELAARAYQNSMEFIHV